MIILVAIGLTALFSLLEFVEQLASVGQGHYHLSDALFYVVLTAPARLLRVTPVSMLLGCLMALGALARGSELTAMRSLGISEGRIIGAAIALALPVIALLFLIAQFVVPPAQQRAKALRLSVLSPSAIYRGENSFWAQSHHEYLNVQQFGDTDAPQVIDIFTFAANGQLKSFVHAGRAEIRPGGLWLLSGVTRKRVIASQFYTEHLATLDWRSFLSRKQIRLLMLSPQDMPPLALYRYVRQLERQHRPAIRFEQDLWARVSIPLTIIAMVMIAGPFAFARPRAQNAGQLIMIGTVFGVIFTLIQQIIDRLEMLLDLNPMAAACAPPLLLMALAILLFTRAHP